MTWNWWVLLVLPFAWFVQNCLHEGSHALAGWAQEGIKTVGFYPWPHMYQGHFYFARYLYEAPKAPEPPHRFRFIAPLVTALTLMATLVVLMFTVVPLQHRIWLVPSAACGLGDALWWLESYLWGNPQRDGQLWKHGTPAAAGSI